ncbi:hypothetical protein AA0Y32_10225 [Georgenia phoenicis]|uniref:hypothetical protein n=1 Tax=unclassified Georgenia TaxID=2626815 RepID=UPI0039AED76E
MFTKTIRAGATSLTALALALSLAACSSEESEPETTSEPATQEAIAEETTPAAEETAPAQSKAADQEAALDEYIALEQAQLDAAGDSFAEIYSEITVTPQYPDTVVFSYTYAQQVDAALASEELAAQAKDLQELCETAVFPAMEATGVGPTQQVTYIYTNADGSEIWSQTYSS